MSDEINKPDDDAALGGSLTAEAVVGWGRMAWESIKPLVVAWAAEEHLQRVVALEARVAALEVQLAELRSQ